MAEARSLWTGLDFTLNAASVEETAITVDWAADSTLVAGLDDREQKEDFFFYDQDSLRWFMMDSLYQTLLANFSVEEIYYTMEGGLELSFDEMYPVSAFPADIPYMGSPFYFAHAGVPGEGDEAVDFSRTEGTWVLSGEVEMCIRDRAGRRGKRSAFPPSGGIHAQDEANQPQDQILSAAPDGAAGAHQELSPDAGGGPIRLREDHHSGAFSERPAAP